MKNETFGPHTHSKHFSSAQAANEHRIKQSMRLSRHELITCVKKLTECTLVINETSTPVTSLKPTTEVITTQSCDRKSRNEQ